MLEFASGIPQVLLEIALRELGSWSYVSRNETNMLLVCCFLFSNEVVVGLSSSGFSTF